MFINENDIEHFFKEYTKNNVINKGTTDILQYTYSSDINVFSDNLFFVKSKIPKIWENELNSFGYRSDEFIKKHNNKHFLFSGCSNTYGVGLSKDEMWSYRLYNKINEKEQSSGYFNLASGGTGIQYLVINLFNYFKKFGNPNVIFLNLPDQQRFIDYVNKEKQYKNIYYKTNNIESSYFLNHYYYLILEHYCIVNNIKLYSISWSFDQDIGTNTLFKKSNFKTFYTIDYQEMINYISSEKEKYSYKYYDIARDKMHQGVGYNIYWSNFLYEKYLKDNDNIRN